MTDSLKLFGLLNRRSGMTLEQFSHHWRDVHGPLALRIKLFDRYVQNHRRPELLPDLAPPADGIPMCWVETLADGLAIPSDPAYLEGAYLDELNFMNARSVGGIVRERVVIAGEPPADDGAPKALFTFRRRSGLSPEEFHAAWGAANRPWFCPANGLSRFVQSTVLPEIYELDEPPVDVIEEVWWPDEAGLARATVTADRLNVLADLCDPDGIRGMLVREERLR